MLAFCSPLLPQGNLSVCLSEEKDSSVPFETTAGVHARATYWFLKGGDGTQMVLPPPSKGQFRRSGELTCNSSMQVWSRVGGKSSLGLHETKSIPTVKGDALRNSSNFAFPPGGMVVPDSCVVLAMMIEKAGDVSTEAEYETAKIACNLHDYHAQARKEDEIPEFCKNACRIGVRELNMKQAVNIVGRMPAEEVAPKATPKSSPSPSSSPPSPSSFTAPGGMDGLSPGNLELMQTIMLSLQTGKPNMGQIEMGLGDPEVSSFFRHSCRACAFYLIRSLLLLALL